MSKLDEGHQRFRRSLNTHCRVRLHEVISDLDSWDSVFAKNGVTCQDWMKDTRDTE